MPPLTISDVAQRVGLRTSAIRYYEEIGILPAAHRISGQRRYDSSVFPRLAVILRAQRLGFALDEIRQLFVGFDPDSRKSSRAFERWQKLSRKKLDELDLQMREIRMMQRRLREMIRKCRCETLDQCGKGILASACGASEKPLPAKRRSL
jgi:MerR family transcriptional regulator, redox-sensitive transcriptional activator SoxR